MTFVESILPYVLEDAKTSGVLPSITIAQAILESNWGKSKLATEGKNLFGIKGNGGIYETQEFVNGRMITVRDGFRHYDDWGGSIRDHSDFLLVNKRYEKAGFFDCCRSFDYGNEFIIAVWNRKLIKP